MIPPWVCKLSVRVGAALKIFKGRWVTSKKKPLDCPGIGNCVIMGMRAPKIEF